MSNDVSNTLSLLSPEGQALLFTEASTAYTFSDEPIADSQLQAIWDLIKWAPTSMNSNPLRILAVQSPKGRERLVSHMSENNKAKTSIAPLSVVLAADVEFREYFPELQPFREHPEKLFPKIEAREKFARFNATLQVGYFIIGIRAMGLVAGPMGGFDADGIDREFFPDGRWKSLLVINIGKPGPEAFRDRLARLDFEQVCQKV